MNAVSISHSSKLDVLRILLCACVLFCHFAPGGCHALSGHVGVLGFFVLSGYLLQTSFFRMEHFNVERFYGGKARRLLPIFAISIVLSVAHPLMFWALGKGAFPILPAEKDIYSLFKYIWYYNIPAWYMGCLIVYLLMAPALWWLHRIRWGIALLFAGAFAFSAFLYWRYDGTSAVLMGMEGAMCPYPQVRLWQFLAGMLVCRCGHASCLRLPSTHRLVAAFAVLSMLVAFSFWVSVYFKRGNDLPNCFLFDVATVMMLGLLVALWDDARAFTLKSVTKIMAWLASLTYGVYLLHMVMALYVDWIRSRFPDSCNRWVMIILAIGLAAVLTQAVNYACAWYWRKK